MHAINDRPFMECYTNKELPTPYNFVRRFKPMQTILDYYNMDEGDQIEYQIWSQFCFELDRKRFKLQKELEREVKTLLTEMEAKRKAKRTSSCLRPHLKRIFHVNNRHTIKDIDIQDMLMTDASMSY